MMADTFVETAKIIRERFLPQAILSFRWRRAKPRLQFRPPSIASRPVKCRSRLLFGHAQDALGAAGRIAGRQRHGDAGGRLAQAADGDYLQDRQVLVLADEAHGLSAYVGCPNVLAGRFVVPEILQDEATPENLAEALVKLYGDKENAEAVEAAFTDIHFATAPEHGRKGRAAVIEYLN